MWNRLVSAQLNSLHAPALSCVTLICLLLPTSTAFAAVDIADARDPLDLERFPRSWIVLYERDDQLVNREFVVSRVDKTRRDVRVEREVRTPAALESATYEMPAGSRAQDVINHYLERVGTGELFSCRGRSCGRSNHWANHIFKQAILFGPDHNQYYFAGEFGDRLLSLYVIERGNKRVYAHLTVLTPQQPVAVTYNQEMVDQLSGNGFVVLEGITPNTDGSLSEQARDRLSDLAQSLQVLNGQEVFVVCHLYGSLATDELLERAGSCSEEAVELLGAADGPTLIAFAAGPLLPRPAGTMSRLELILPHRLDFN